MPSSNQPPEADATLAWNQLSTQVDALIAKWDAADQTVPDLANFIPAQPQMLRHMMLVELIKVDLEYRWQQRDLPKTIEQYTAEFPELLADNGPPCDLIYEEFQVRRRLQHAPLPREYFERFPRHADQLRRLMKFADTAMTTTLVKNERVPSVDAGQQIDDFDLLTRLGTGAFASVFLARQRSMQRLVALKISRDRGAEPQTLAELDHPYIVRVYDQRTLPERHLRLMYMQHIPGGTLQGAVNQVRDTPAVLRSGKILVEAVNHTLLDRGESPPTESSIRRRLAQMSWPDAVCWLGTRLASALDYAHQRGVLHRDVKPANVLLDGECNPKLADFNVSFSSKLDGSTPAAYFGGSLAYMSPEQLQASDPDHPREADTLDGRSDVFSLAVMLWELLTGSRPFPDEAAKSWGETLKLLTWRRQQGIDDTTRAKLPKNLPPSLEEFLLNALAADPKQRPASAGEFSRQLQMCLHPRAQRLMHPPPNSISAWMRAWPITTVIIGGVVPNAILSLFNTYFNINHIISLVNEQFGDSVKDIFYHWQILTINGVAYSTGIAVGVTLAWPLLSTLRAVQAREPVETDRLPALRRRCLYFGDAITWLTIALWIVAGFAFPVWLHLAVDFQAAHYAIFVPSMILCGLISSTQTFLLLTYMVMHAFYPALLSAGMASDEDLSQMQGLARRSWVAFGLAIAAPLLAVLTAMVHPEAGTSETYRHSVQWLAALGLAGSVTAFWLWRHIQDDVGSLAVAVAPSAEGSGEMSDSFWTGSR